MGTTARADHKGTDEMAESRSVHSREEPRGGGQKTNRRRDVTPEQKQRIHELYAKTGNGHAVAQLLGLGSTTVYNHLGLGRGEKPRWTDDENQELVDGYLAKKPVREIAKRIGKSPGAVAVQMCRHRKEVRKNPKKRMALSAITMALKAVRKADIFREVEP